VRFCRALALLLIATPTPTPTPTPLRGYEDAKKQKLNKR
jgi:hypothetical protein